jgi:hypothetical protein
VSANVPNHFQSIDLGNTDVQKKNIRTGGSSRLANRLHEIDSGFSVVHHMKRMRDPVIFQGDLDKNNVIGIVFDKQHF